MHPSPTLVVLAAGMGSRFGGDKQTAAVGPRGETILEFTVHDALRAGFGDVVLVVRPDNRQQVEDQVGRRLAERAPVRYLHQEIAEPLPGLHSPAGRKKPWGTAQALAQVFRLINGPCGVVNADDWYGGAAPLQALADLLAGPAPIGLVLYQLGHTLSPHGGVNRAVCSLEGDRLTGIVETMHLTQVPDGASSDGRFIPANTPVSLNLWGFQPTIHTRWHVLVDSFLRAHIHDLKAECYLPSLVMDGLRHGDWWVQCRQVESDWAGLTYPDDRPGVVARLAAATAAGAYPSPLA